MRVCCRCGCDASEEAFASSGGICRDCDLHMNGRRTETLAEASRRQGVEYETTYLNTFERYEAYYKE